MRYYTEEGRRLPVIRRQKIMRVHYSKNKDKNRGTPAFPPARLPLQATAAALASTIAYLDLGRRREVQLGEGSEYAVRQGELRKFRPREEASLDQLLVPLPFPVGTRRRILNNPLARTLLLLSSLAWAGCCCCRLVAIPLTLAGFPSVAASSRSSLRRTGWRGGGVGAIGG